MTSAIVFSTMLCKLLLSVVVFAVLSPWGEAGPAKVTVASNEPPVGGVQPEVAAALLSMAKQHQNNQGNAQVIRKYEKLLADAQQKAKAGVSLAHRGENNADHHATLSENVAKLFKFPKKLLGLGSGVAEEKKGEKLNAAAAAAAAAAVKKGVRQAKKKDKSKKNARKDSGAKKHQLLLAQVVGTTAGGHSSIGQSFPTASSPIRKTSNSGFSNYADHAAAYSGADVASIGATNYASGGGAQSGSGQSIEAVADVGDDADDFGGSGPKSYGVGLLASAGIKDGSSSGGGGAYADSHGNKGYYNDLSSYGSIDVGGGGGAGGILGGLASGLLSANVIKGLGFLLPIGLFLAALPPNVINVAVTGTAGAQLANTFSTSLLPGKRWKRSPTYPAEEYDDENLAYYPLEFTDRMDGDASVETETAAPSPSDVADSPITNSHQAPTTETSADDQFLGANYFDDPFAMTGATWPVLDMIDEYGVTALLTEPECQKRVFCEMVQLGRGPDGNSVQRSLWNAVVSVPKAMIGTYVDAKMLSVVREGKCESFFCAKRHSYTYKNNI